MGLKAFLRARVLIAALLLLAWMPGAQAAESSRVALDKSIKPVAPAYETGSNTRTLAFVSRATLQANESAATLPFEVVLKLRNFDELKARVAKGDHVSPAEMTAKYEPSQADYQAVIDWLTSEGLTITRRDGNHMAIFAEGSVSQVARATQAKFARVTMRGKEYTSAVTAPSVPASISPLLIGINGLQPHLHPHKHVMYPNASSGSASYSPAQIAQAYNVSGLYASNITGAGQSIAIVIDTFPAAADLIGFWNAYGINQSIKNIQFIQAVPGTLDPPSGEETLDTEWSSSMAPGAKVRVYAATDLGNADLDEAYQQVYEDAMAHPEYGIHQMSMSYGAGEIETTDTQMSTDDQYFVELTNAGVTCFASTGDEGSTPGTDNQGNQNEDGNLEPESPASDPNVIAVGGTTLKLNSSNNETSEVVWNNSIGASGGGTSTYFARPSWQTGTGVASGTKRLLPDISCAADPDYGADIVFEEGFTIEGGTSWACPTCAGFCALMNEACSNLGLGYIGQLGPYIYPQIGSANFRDIVSGNNATAASGSTNGVPNYTAQTGYDEATGIGVPLVQTLAETIARTSTLVGVGQASVLETVNQGQNATVTVTATGSPTGYQWQRMAIGTTTWSNLSDNGTYSGSATATLTVTSTTPAMSGDQFQCVVTYAAKTVTSAQPTALIVETPWIISTLAGTAGTAGLVSNTGTAAEFSYPSGIAIDSSGNLYVADLDNNVIRKVTPAGVVTTPYGSLSGTAGHTDAIGNSALFNAPRDIAIDSSGNLYVSDEGSNFIRKIVVSTGQVSTIAGTASTTSPIFSEPKGIAVDATGNVFVADSGNNVIRKITTGGVVSIVAGSSTFVAGFANGNATTQALFNEPIGLAVDGSDNLYVTEYNNEVIRKITSGGAVSTFAGQAGVAGCLDGTGTQALFNVPRGIMIDGSGNLYVTDSYAQISTPPPNISGNNLLRKITSAGVVTTLAGAAGIAGSSDGTGSSAQFFNPCGLAMNSSGRIYIADASNDTIRSALQSSVSVTSSTAYASASGPMNGQFTVTRAGTTSGSLTVNYAVTGTAVSGTDYTPLSGSVTIPDGSSSATITVVPLTDNQATSSRTVIVTLTSAGASVMINATPAIVTISEAQAVTFSQWETAHSISDGTTATPFADGVPELLKYLFDIDPTMAMSGAARGALPTVGTTTTGGTSYLTLTYRQYVAASGVTVHVQTSANLQTWTTATNANLIETGTDPTTGDPILQAQVPITTTPQFIRLNVVGP